MQKIHIALIAATATLAACSQTDEASQASLATNNALYSEATPNSRICQPVPVQEKGQWGVCVHRMAYKYARSPDPAEVVAKAVSAACGDPIAELLNSVPREERLDLGSKVMGAIDSLALIKVIEARAGRCEVPN